MRKLAIILTVVGLILSGCSSPSTDLVDIPREKRGQIWEQCSKRFSEILGESPGLPAGWATNFVGLSDGAVVMSSMESYFGAPYLGVCTWRDGVIISSYIDAAFDAK